MMYSIVQWYCALELTSVLLLMPWLYAVICSRNWVPRPGSKLPYLVPNPGTWISTMIVQNTTNFGLYLRLLTTLNAIVVLIVLSTSHSQTSSFDYS